MLSGYEILQSLENQLAQPFFTEPLPVNSELDLLLQNWPQAAQGQASTGQETLAIENAPSEGLWSGELDLSGLFQLDSDQLNL